MSLGIVRNVPWSVKVWLWILLSTAGVPSNKALAQQLSLPTVVASAGDSVDVSVEYRAQGAEISAFEFDLQYDPSVLNITATIGSAALAADKLLVTGVLPNGNIRFLIFGINQNVIPDGSLVDLTIEVSASSAVGPYPLVFLNANAASPDAEGVPLRTHDGRIIRVGPP
jgi:hypothetical protein